MCGELQENLIHGEREAVEEKAQRPKSHVLQGLDWGKSFYYVHEANAFIESLETELRETKRALELLNAAKASELKKEMEG